jgi:hypothetical protein
MSWKIFPSIIVVFLTISKMYFQQKNGHFFETIGWLIAGIWFFWITYAYLQNKDLPMVGSFGYKSGNNQPGRMLVTCAMLLIYAVAIFWG